MWVYPGPCMAPNLRNLFIKFGDSHGPKSYVIRFGDSHGPEPYEFVGSGAIQGPGCSSAQLHGSPIGPRTACPR